MNTDRPIAEDDVQAFVDGRLPPDQAVAMNTYLAAHPDEARRVGRLKGLRTDLRAMLGPYAEEPVPPALDLTRMLAARRNPRSMSRSVPWASIAASVCMLFVGGASGWIARTETAPPRHGLAALAQEAAYTYEVFAPERLHPIEVKASDRDQLATWMTNRLHHPATIPDLAKSGYRFMGGRLVATPQGPAGLYMYDDDKGTRVTLLVRPMDTDATVPMKEDKGAATLGYSWAAKGLGYSLVGPDGVPHLRPLANEIRRQVGTSI